MDAFKSFALIRVGHVATIIIVVGLLGLLGAGCQVHIGSDRSPTTPISSSVVPLDRTSSQAALAAPISSKPRSEVITYVVQTGENIFSIADKFGLHAETILWANETTLRDNPHNMKPGMALIIPPVDGIRYLWRRDDDLNKVAERFSVEPEVILNWPGNQLDPQTLNIEPGTWLIIPGGHRPLTNSNGITIHTPSDQVDPTPQP